MADFTPTNALDDQFCVIVDVRDPRHPKEVGRRGIPERAPARHVCRGACLSAIIPITVIGRTTLRFGRTIRIART